MTRDQLSYVFFPPGMVHAKAVVAMCAPAPSGVLVALISFGGKNALGVAKAFVAREDGLEILTKQYDTVCADLLVEEDAGETH